MGKKEIFRCRVEESTRRREQRAPSVTTFSNHPSRLDRRVQAVRNSFPEKKMWGRKLAVQTLSGIQQPVCREGRMPV